jgi:DNA-binding NtrC family response regulator
MNRVYKILVADDEAAVCALLAELLSDLYEVDSISRGDLVLERLRTGRYDILILDLQLPGLPGIEVLKQIETNKIPVSVIVLTANNDVSTAITAMKLGAYDYMLKPFDNEKMLIIAKNAVEKIELQTELDALKEEVSESLKYSLSLVGASQTMMKVFESLERVIDTESTILITGESGTGKGVLARAIHYNSNRRSFPFRSVDCSTMPEDLIASELFGHEKGSFTGAIARKIGKFEAADKGTMFLDEISNISIDIQAKLLGVIQEKEVERIGSNQVIKINTRILAASNKDLRHLVQEGKFREDLYYRLNVVPVHIPPLRKRREDIPLFIDYFLERFNNEYSRDISIDPEGRVYLAKLDWPGNVRQLENVMRRIVLLSQDGIVDTDDVFRIVNYEDISGAKPPIGQPNQTTVNSLFHNSMGKFKTFSEIEKEMICEALSETGFNITETSKILGLSRKTIHNKMNEYHITIRKKIT